MRRFTFRSLLQRASNVTRLTALAVSCTALGGCMNFDDSGPITLATHVDDWRDEMIYQILIDRFADGDQANDYTVDPTTLGHWQGGDWQGVIDHLGYIQSLGVTTIWISPVVKNVDNDSGFDGYHGYWTQDFGTQAPNFGDIPTLRRMVDAAHAVGIKVILDIVVNHIGQVFYYDINENGQPDVSISGGGCDKWDDPADTTNLYPDYSSSNPNCIVLDGQSGVEVVNEYDPEFSASGVVQAFSSLGYSGPAPIVFLDDPTSNHEPPQPPFFQNIDVFNRRGGTVNYSIGDQLVHGDFPGGLKDVATYRCDVKQQMVQSYANWVEIADFDGFRIDTVKHVEPEFWRYFSQKIRQRLAKEGKKNFIMFGESFDGDDQLVGSFTMNGPTPGMPVAPQDFLGAPDLAKEQSCLLPGDTTPITGDMLDSAFYFPQYYTVVSGVLHNGGATQPIQDLWTARQKDWGTIPAVGGTGIAPASLPINFLDNHDVGRFLFTENFTTDSADLAAGNISQQQFDTFRASKLKNAMVFVYTEQGIPCLYYGDEQGFSGGNDPTNREIMWPTGYATTPTTDPTSGANYGTFVPWVQKLTAIRKAYPALRRGDQNVIWATTRTPPAPDAGIFAFERSGGDAGDAYAAIIINTNRDSSSSPEYNGAPMKVTAPAGTTLVDVLGESPQTYTVATDGSLSITMPPLTAVVLVPSGQVAH